MVSSSILQPSAPPSAPHERPLVATDRPREHLRGAEHVRYPSGRARRMGVSSADGTHVRGGSPAVEGRQPNSLASPPNPSCASTASKPSARRRTTSARVSIAPRPAHRPPVKVMRNWRNRCRGSWCSATRQWCATRWPSDELTDPLKDLLGHAMHRTAADLSCALLRTYEFYTDAPPKAWYELNQLYRLADELGIATNAYADEQSRGGGMLTLADVYLRIALLAVGEAEPVAPEGSVGGLQRARSMDAADHHRRAGRRHDVRRRSRRRFAAELSRTR